MRPYTAWKIVFGLSLLLAALFVATGIAAGPFRRAYFTADHLYIPTLFADLTRWNGQLADWHLTPAPYLFPDMFLYGVMRSIMPSLEAAQYFTCYLQLALIICAARALVARALPNSDGSTALVAAAWVAWLLVYLVDDSALIGPTFIYSAHGGALLASLCVFASCTRPQRRPHVAGTIAVAAISALTGASVALFVASCSAPLGAAALCYAPTAWRAWSARDTERAASPAPVLIGRAALGAACGAAGLWFARSAGLAREENLSGSRALALETARLLWNGPEPHGRIALCSIACVSIAAITFALATRRDAQHAGLRALAFWQVAAALVVTCALFYAGAYRDRWTLRYLVVPANLSVVFLAALLAQRAQSARNASLWPTRAAVTLTLATAVGLVTQAATLWNGTYAAPHRNAAACVHRIAEREDVTTILADYWFAKPLMLLTDDRAHVVQVRHNMQPYFWINSRGWYRRHHEFGIVITNGLDTQRTIKLFGEPQSVERCDDLELFVYRQLDRVWMGVRMRKLFNKAMARAG